MANVSLDNQNFYTPAMAAHPRSTSRCPVFLKPGFSQDDAIIIPSDIESDYGDFDDDLSDTSLPSLEDLRASAGKGSNATSGVSNNNHTEKLSVEGANPDGESVSSQQQQPTDSLGCSPEPRSPFALPTASSANPPQAEHERQISVSVASRRPSQASVPEKTTGSQSAGKASSAPSPEVEAQHLSSPGGLPTRSSRPEDGPQLESTTSRDLGASSNSSSPHPETQPPEARPKRIQTRKRTRPDRPRNAPSDDDADDDCPPSLDGGGEQAEDDNAFSRQPRRKRRKATSTTRATPGTAAVHRRRPIRPVAPLLDTNATIHGGLYCGIPSPPHSQSSIDGGMPVEALSRRFKAWLTETAVVQCATVDGVMTFQLQFKEDLLCSKHRRHVLSSPPSSHSQTIGSRPYHSSVKRHYSTKQGSRAKITFVPGENALSQTDDDVATLASAEESEYDVEKILETRKLGEGHQVHVKWVGYEEPTWEPLENLLKTEALDAYEMQHGKIMPRPDQGGVGVNVTR